MAKKNQVAKVKNLDCLNCGYPFFGSELYCPECGQKNNQKRINFGNFIKEVFNGFFSWDAKFWKTLLPLLTKPGKVSKDYIEGKRARYTNPFRFYITTSILFFLLLGLGNIVKEYRDFNSDKSVNTDLGFIKINTNDKKENAETSDVVDGWNSYQKKKNKDKSNEDIALDTVQDTKKVTINKAEIMGKDITSYVDFQKKYPELPIHQALDSLKVEKTFLNKFLYKKAKTINGFSKDPTQSVNILINEATSHVSTAIFILLPIFALFLRLLYVRRKYSYIDHLIFVFHTQTIFFILLIIFSLIQFVFPSITTSIIYDITLLIFVVYLFVAMKVFYEQGYFKTFIKFIITLVAYSSIALIGTSIVTVIAFMMMK